MNKLQLSMILLVLSITTRAPAQEAPGKGIEIFGDTQALVDLQDAVKLVAPDAQKFAWEYGHSDVQRIKLYFETVESATKTRLEENLNLRTGLLDEVVLLPRFNYENELSIIHDPVFSANLANLIRLTPTEGRIVGALGLAGDDFADCVAVGNGADWCCTGTLIGPNTVLTAGHCDDGGCSSRVFVGQDVDKPGTAYPVASAYRHGDYVGHPDYNNDLTVLVLERNVDGVRPRAIASAQQIEAAKFVRLMGYGNIDSHGTYGYGKRRFTETAMASPSCSRPEDASRYGCHSGLEMVCGQKGLNQDSCRGDSGGPVYIQVGEQWLLAGATSRATDESDQVCGDGGNYVRVDQYMEWIRQLPDVSLGG